MPFSAVRWGPCMRQISLTHSHSRPTIADLPLHPASASPSMEFANRRAWEHQAAVARGKVKLARERQMAESGMLSAAGSLSMRALGGVDGALGAVSGAGQLGQRAVGVRGPQEIGEMQGALYASMLPFGAQGLSCRALLETPLSQFLTRCRIVCFAFGLVGVFCVRACGFVDVRVVSLCLLVLRVCECAQSCCMLASGSGVKGLVICFRVASVRNLYMLASQRSCAPAKPKSLQRWIPSLSCRRLACPTR